MKKILIVIAMVTFVVSLGFAQNVIKYDLTSTSGDLDVGLCVKLTATDNECEPANSADNVIGFVAMRETSGGNTYNLIVNSGRLTSAVSEGVSSGDELTASTAGSLKVASGTDRVVAMATEDAAAHGPCEIMILLEPIPGKNGSQIWQTSAALTGITGTDAARQELLSIDITDIGLEYAKIHFTGTADDKAAAQGGAVIHIDIYEDNDPNDGQLAEQTLYLVDRNFYQSDAVSITATQDVTGTNDPHYNVRVWESDGMTNGQIKGVLTVIATPNP